MSSIKILDSTPLPVLSSTIWHWLTSPRQPHTCLSGWWPYTRELGMSANCDVNYPSRFWLLRVIPHLIMGLMALNRYTTVVKRVLCRKFFFSKRAAKLHVVLVWLFTMLFATPPMYVWGKYQHRYKFSLCSFSWQLNHKYSYNIIFLPLSISKGDGKRANYECPRWTKRS